MGWRSKPDFECGPVAGDKARLATRRNRKRKEDSMKNATKQTRIEDIPAVGAELSEEHLRLAAGGARCIATRYGTNDYVNQVCRIDSDTIVLR